MIGLFENPFPILFTGILVFSIVFTIWTQKRTSVWLVFLFVVMLLTIAGLITERLVVTERETVKATIHQIARDMEANDIPALLGHISESEVGLRNRAESILSRVTVESVSVKRNLSVTIADFGDRNTAVARFNAVARIEDKSGTFGHSTIPRYMILNLVRENGSWRVTDYEDRMPQEGIGR